MEFVKDLFLTESFLIKGYVKTGGRRLTTFLNTTGGRFIEVHDATLVGVAQGDRIVTARAMVNLDEILIAHELIGSAGDDLLRRLAEPAKDRALVNLYLGGRLALEISGKMLRRAYNRTDLGEQRFLVVTDTAIEGLAGKKPREFAVLKRAPYLIVNRTRIAYVFDYSP